MWNCIYIQELSVKVEQLHLFWSDGEHLKMFIQFCEFQMFIGCNQMCNECLNKWRALGWAFLCVYPISVETCGDYPYQCESAFWVEKLAGTAMKPLYDPEDRYE